MTAKKEYYHLKLDICSTKDFLQEINQTLIKPTPLPKLVYFINAHCFNISLKNTIYLKALRKADYVLNDGIGIKIGARLLNIDLIENMNGTDLIPKLIKLSYQNKKRIFLLGAKDGIAKKAAQKLKTIYPDILISGYASGYFEKNQINIVNQVISSETDILIVGMGVPKQEIWLMENKTKLNNVCLAVAGGAILDFLAEEVKRAPLWLQKIGLEWMFRFLQEPRRLFKRYFIGNITFLFHLLKIRTTPPLK